MPSSALAALTCASPPADPWILDVDQPPPAVVEDRVNAQSEVRALPREPDRVAREVGTWARDALKS
jgi:hypothetical protein